MTELTAHEFAAKHIADTGCNVTVDWHVDILIRAALYESRDLWDVTIDDTGHVTFTWLTLDVRLWEALLDKAIQKAAEVELDAFMKRAFPA